MERQEFLSKLGMGMVMACAGCSLIACGSKGSDPAPQTTGTGTGTNTTPPATGSGNLFTVDLSNQLQNIGDSSVNDGVILVRIASGNTAAAFTAVQVACTHQGNSIGYNTGQGIFICPAHGSEFSKTGAVVLGPAAKALQRYNVTIDGTTLTVTA